MKRLEALVVTAGAVAIITVGVMFITEIIRQDITWF